MDKPQINWPRNSSTGLFTQIFWFPEIGPPPVIIHRWISHYKPTSYWGTSMAMESHPQIWCCDSMAVLRWAMKFVK